jgi:hypothetical protein
MTKRVNIELSHDELVLFMSFLTVQLAAGRHDEPGIMEAAMRTASWTVKVERDDPAFVTLSARLQEAHDATCGDDDDSGGDLSIVRDAIRDCTA